MSIDAQINIEKGMITVSLWKEGNVCVGWEQKELKDEMMIVLKIEGLADDVTWKSIKGDSHDVG